jgi:hypothetical protein
MGLDFKFEKMSMHELKRIAYIMFREPKYIRGQRLRSNRGGGEITITGYEVAHFLTIHFKYIKNPFGNRIKIKLPYYIYHYAAPYGNFGIGEEGLDTEYHKVYNESW